MWADATEGCNVVRINLEARLRPVAAGNGMAGFGQVSGGGRRFGAGGGLGSGSGIGSGSGGARIVSKDTSGSDASYDVDVWLVHQPPTGAERVLQVQPRFKGDWFNLTFRPLRIDTPRGGLDVAVGLSLVLTTGTTGSRELWVSTTRKVNVVQSGEDSRADVRKPPESAGSSETKMPMPSPGDVLSFEMPPLQNPAGGPALPDRLSVRLRIKPVE
jgi:hypothetical protein